jgi:hypothetical protein
LIALDETSIDKKKDIHFNKIEQEEFVVVWKETKKSMARLNFAGIVFGLLFIISGDGIRRKKNWGKFMFYILSFPLLGILLFGLYGLVNLNPPRIIGIIINGFLIIGLIVFNIKLGLNRRK